MQMQVWPPCLVSTWVCFWKVTTVQCWRIKMIEHTLIWTHLVWTIGLLSWRLTALTPTREHVSTAVQIRITHSSSAAQHGSSGKAPTYAFGLKHIQVFQTSFTVLYFPQNNRFWHDRWRLKFTAWKMSHYDPEEWNKHTRTVRKAILSQSTK